MQIPARHSNPREPGTRPSRTIKNHNSRSSPGEPPTNHQPAPVQPMLSTADFAFANVECAVESFFSIVVFSS
jgi:hypothetical protein